MSSLFLRSAALFLGAIFLVAGASAQTLTVTASPQSPSVREGGSLVFTVTAPADATVQWSRDAVELAGETGATLVLDNLRSADQGAIISVRAFRASDGASGTATLDPLVITLSPDTSYLIQNAANRGPGSLREAINLAQVSSADPAIVRVLTFDPSLAGQTITLLSEIVVGGDSNIRIDATAFASGVTISGGNTTRLFSLIASDVLDLRGLRLTGGNGAGVASPGSGGAILSAGLLSLTSCTLSGNTAAEAGAIFQTTSALTMTDCLVSGNAATGAGGGVEVGASETILLRCAFSDNSAGGNSGAFRVAAGAALGSVLVEACEFSSNRAGGAGGAATFGGAAGSAFSVVRSTFRGNTAAVAGGAVASFGGNLTVLASTFSANTSVSGGAIYQQSTGPLALTLCTLSGNFGVDTGGGGALFAFQGTTTIDSCTIAGNLASGTAGGGGILLQAPASVSLRNSVLALNRATAAEGDDVFFSGGTLTALEANLIGNNETATAVFPTGTLAGTASAPLDPRLSPLGQFGGPTATRLPLDGSPALNAATGSVSEAVDQRGFPRVVGSAPDLGAVERGPVVTITSTADAGAGSLRAAVDAATSPDTRVRFAASLSGQTITLSSGALSIPLSRVVDIDASALAAGITLSGNSTDRIFDVRGGVLNLRRLALKAGQTPVGGAGIRSFGATTLTDCVISGCMTPLEGGAIFAGSGSLDVISSTLSANSASSGAALVVEGDATIARLINSTIASNSATAPSGTGGVGGLLLRGGSVVVLHATVAFNTGGTAGGIFLQAPATLRLERSIVAANTASAGTAPDLLKASGTVMPVSVNLIGNNTSVTTEFPEAATVGTASNPRNPVLGALANYGGFTPTLFPGFGSPAIDAAGFSSLLTDQRGLPRGVNGLSDLGAVEVGAPDPSAARLVNVSTRLRAGTGDSVPIAGFAIRGGTKKVAIRVLGPTLGQFGVPGPLANPTLTLMRAGESVPLKTNDNWQDDAASAAELTNAGIALPNALECGVVVTLADGTYTAVVRGVSDGVGACLVEVYDLESGSAARLVNLSTRGPVGTGDNVMIGGIVIGPGQSKRVLFRVLGPSLTQFGVPAALPDPTLEVLAGGTTLALNDDWQSSQVNEITASGLAPFDAREPAVILTLGPGSYTAIVRGKNNTTGNAIVEVYDLP